MSESQELQTCPNCGGHGTEATLDEPTGDDKVVEKVPVPCRDCQGKGQVTEDKAEEIRERFRDMRDNEEADAFEAADILDEDLVDEDTFDDESEEDWD